MLRFVEGWDFFSASQFSARGWTSAVDALSAGRFAGQAVHCRNGDHPGIHVLPSTYSTVVVGFALNQDGTLSDGAQRHFALQAAGAGTASYIISIVTDTSGHIIVANSANSTLATGTTVIPAGVWAYIEVKAFVNGASGTIEVHLNGAPEIASTTVNIGSTNIGQIMCGSQGSTTYGGIRGCLIDDIYVVDTTGSVNNTFLGDSRIETLMPSADGAHSQWTPNSGSAHYSRVNEQPPDGDTSYVSDATINDRDSYVFADLATLSGLVYGVQKSIYIRKDDASLRQVCPVTRPASTDHDGATVTLGSSYQYFSEIDETNPDTSALWTISGVNGSEFGVKVVA